MAIKIKDMVFRCLNIASQMTPHLIQTVNGNTMQLNYNLVIFTEYAKI